MGNTRLSIEQNNTKRVDPTIIKISGKKVIDSFSLKTKKCSNLGNKYAGYSHIYL